MENLLKVYRSVKTDDLTQGFGENKTFIRLDESGKVIRPFIITKSKKNSIPFYSYIGLKGHNGHDFACWSGEPVYHSANFNGWLKHESDLDGGIGVDIVSNGQIVRDEVGNLQYVKFRVWHGKQVIGKDRQPVKFGDLIMLGDSTGSSGGNHVHQCLKWCDINGRGIKQDNGWEGVVPPELYDFQNTFVGNIVAIEERSLSFMEQIRKLAIGLQKIIKI